ncbi:MAG: caspase family protein [Flammeovirgaceae bacterium]
MKRGLLQMKLESSLFLLFCLLSIQVYAQQDVDVSYGLIKDNYYALILSPDKNEDWGDLSNAVNEGKRLKEILENRYVFKEVKLVKNPTVAGFYEAFSEIQSKLREQDNLFIYYNGHGDIATNESGQKAGFWVMSDTKRKREKTWVLNKDVKNMLDMINCRHILLVVDACFGGSVFMKGPGIPITNDYLKKSCTAITSAGLENVRDGGEFFQFLETTLRTNQKPLLRESELYFDVKKNIDLEREKGKSIPSPKMGPLDERMNGEFVFKLRLEEKNQPVVVKEEVPIIEEKNQPVEEDLAKKTMEPVKDLSKPYFSFQNNTIIYELPHNPALLKGANITAKLYDTHDMSYESMYPHDLLLKLEKNNNNRMVCKLDISRIPWYVKKKDSGHLMVRLRLRQADEVDVELGKFTISN